MEEPIILNTDINDDKTSVTLALEIPATLIYFQGHFPNNPILPGIVQLKWVKLYAERFLNIAPNTLTRVPQLKFTHIIQPNDKITLAITRFENHLTFKIYDNEKSFATGKITT